MRGRYPRAKVPTITSSTFSVDVDGNDVIMEYDPAGTLTVSSDDLDVICGELESDDDSEEIIEESEADDE